MIPYPQTTLCRAGGFLSDIGRYRVHHFLKTVPYGLSDSVMRYPLVSGPSLCGSVVNVEVVCDSEDVYQVLFNGYGMGRLCSCHLAFSF